MMDETSFKEWLEEPATEYFMKYISDLAEDEVDTLKDGIIGGAILSERDQVRVAALVEAMGRISEIDLEEIEEFYRKEEE